MSDLRSVALRSASASAADLAPFRSNATVAKLLADVDAVFGLSAQAANKKQAAGAVAVPQYKNEYEVTCVLRFLYRCMVASDDAAGRDADAVRPRANIAVDEIALLVDAFTGHVSQAAVGLMAVDGLYRLVSVYGHQLVGAGASSQGDAASALKNSGNDKKRLVLEKVADSLFFGLAVQELPTMCRRNALKVLVWFVAHAAAWDAAVAVARRNIERDQGVASAKTATNAGALEFALDVSAHAAWLAVLAECTNEERDPVNVLAVFDICIAAHNAVLRKLLSPPPSSSLAAGGATAAWPPKAARFVLGKILLTEQQRQELHESLQSDAASAAASSSPSVTATMTDEDEENLDMIVEGLENLYQVCSGYFPLQFSPAPGTAVKKEQLVERLHAALSRPLLGAFALPLVMDKMKSASATATILSCVDVIRRVLAGWAGADEEENGAGGADGADKAPSTPLLTHPVARLVRRRFLRDLFPFLRAFIESQAQSQSQAVAGGVIGLLSDASALYDASWGADAAAAVPIQELLRCPTLNTILRVLPSSGSGGSVPAQVITNSSLLDASLIHAMGRRATCPVLAVALGATVLPLVAADPLRIATTSALCAIFEMNSAPPPSAAASSSSCCGGGCCGNKTATSGCCGDAAVVSASSFSLGSPDSPRAIAFRGAVRLDDKTLSALQAAFRDAMQAASACLGRSDPSRAAVAWASEDDRQHAMRASADLVASATCLRARQLTQLIGDGGDVVDAAQAALLAAWCSAIDRRSWRALSPIVVSSLSSAVGVCLCIAPVPCRRAMLLESALGSPTLARDGDGGDAAAAAEEEEETGKFLRNAAAVLHGVISAAAPHCNAASLDVLVEASLQLRFSALSRLDGNSVSVVDRLCLAPIGDIIVARSQAAAAEQAAPLRALLVAALEKFVVRVFGADADGGASAAPNSQQHQLAFVLELVFEVFCSAASSEERRAATGALVRQSPAARHAAAACPRCAAVLQVALKQAAPASSSSSSDATFAALVACASLRLVSVANEGDDAAIAAATRDALREILRVASTAPLSADECLAECIRAAHLSSRASSAWRVAVAKSLLSAAMATTSATSGTSAEQTLHFYTVLLQSTRGADGSATATFDAILRSAHKTVLPLIRCRFSAAPQQYIDDCLAWMTWMLDGDEDDEDEDDESSPQFALLQHLVPGAQNDDVAATSLVELSELAAATTSTATAAGAGASVALLQRRERALRVLTTIGQRLLDMSLERSARGAAFEAAARPAVPALVKRLQGCLQDKKRAIRAAAGECRHVWMLLPKGGGSAPNQQARSH